MYNGSFLCVCGVIRFGVCVCCCFFRAIHSDSETFALMNNCGLASWWGGRATGRRRTFEFERPIVFAKGFRAALRLAAATQIYKQTRWRRRQRLVTACVKSVCVRDETNTTHTQHKHEQKNNTGSHSTSIE